MQAVTVRASPMAGLYRSAIAQVFLIATGVAAIESLIGIFGIDDRPAFGRSAYLVIMNWIGAGLGIVGYLAARRIRWAHEHFWRRVATATCLVFVPQGLVVWLSTWLVGGRFGPEFLWLFFLYSFFLAGAFIAAFIGPVLDRATIAKPSLGAAGSRFMERLPFRLRGADLWALQAEDHYLRVVTSLGEAQIRLRVADAVRELHDKEGVRAHRSWWVARTAITDMKRQDGRVRFIVLPDEREIPVSRSGSDALKELNWS